MFAGYLNAKKGIVQILNCDYFYEYSITRGQQQFWTIEVNIIGKLNSPRTIHDKCSTSEHSSDMNCTMNGANLECALQPCGGQKYKCDCNVYR